MKKKEGIVFATREGTGWLDNFMEGILSNFILCTFVLCALRKENTKK